MIKRDDPRRIPLDRAATLEQVVEAVSGLSDEDWGRLRFAAEALSRSLPGKTSDDLLANAILLATDREEDRRRWDHERVPVRWFIHGIMKSLVSHAHEKRKRRRDRPTPSKPLVETTDPADLDEMEADDGAIEHRNRRFIEKLEEHFTNDPETADVLAGRLSGMTETEIQQQLGISEQECNARYKKIARHGKKLAAELENEDG